MKIEDYNKYYIQGSDHYLIPKDEFKELFNEMLSWKEENQKQKEVINKAIELNQIINNSDYVYSQDEITIKNLEILEDKEVQE